MHIQSTRTSNIWAGMLLSLFAAPTLLAQSAPLSIEGKTLIVRAYAKGSAAISAYSSSSIAIHDGRAAIPGDSAALYVVFAGDQTDAAVASRFGGRDWIPSPGESIIPDRAGSAPAKESFLADALGQPLPAEGLQAVGLYGEATLDINESGLDDLWRIPMEPVAVDAEGRPLLKLFAGGNSKFKGTLIFHPDYGTALLVKGQSTKGASYQELLPLVRKMSPAASRAVSGQVTTTSGLPVAGALVYPIIARTPGLGESPVFRGAVVADGEGRFTAYPPDPDPLHLRGDLYPLGTTVEVDVFAPPAYGLFPYQWLLPNTRPAAIRMIQGAAFHRFVFQGYNGPIDLADPQNRIELVVRLRNQPESDPELAARETKVPERLVLRGGPIPFGRYSINFSSVGGKWVQFDPIAVDERTSTTVVFRLTSLDENPNRYSGRAINAMTGQPVSGVFVTADPTKSGDRMAEVLPADWDALDGLPDHPDPLDPRLRSLGKILRVKNLVRTGADGTWAINQPPGSRIFYFAVFARDCLALNWRAHPAPGKERRSELPDFKLWPAATATLTAKLPGGAAGNAPLLRARWEFDQNNLPNWAKDLLPVTTPRDFRFYDQGATFDRRGPSKIQIPAEVHLRLKVVSDAEEYGDWTFPNDIFLHQGESIELGMATLPVNATVAVVVVDENGAPVEGVPLKKIDPGRPQSGKIRNTDDQGAAIFFIPPGVKTEIACQPRDEQMRAAETRVVEIEATGNETIPPIFTMKLDKAFIDKALAQKR